MSEPTFDPRLSHPGGATPGGSRPVGQPSESPAIPVCDLSAQFLSLEKELRAAIDRVLARGWFILGEEGRLFEEEFAAWLDVAHAVGVGSGTDALHLALRALEIGPGDLVMTAPNSAVPTACAIVAAGAIPIFADVDLATGLLDPESVERQMNPAVKAIVPVHLYGRCAPMEPILRIAAKRRIPVVEDAAQAHGAIYGGRPAGTLGEIGCFSFYPSKNLGAFGDAGACVTNDPTLAERLRGLRNYGEIERYRSESIGFNSRLDEIQAAVLRAKLPHVSRWNRARRDVAAAYRERLAGLPLVVPPADREGVEVQHLFVIRVARRERLRGLLRERGIGTQVHYPVPIHLQPAYAHLENAPGSFPVAERRALEILSLPMYPEMTVEQIDRVADAIREGLRDEPHPEEMSC